MQNTTIKALVIRETDFSENDRYITVLAENGAKFEILCRGVRRKGNRLQNAVRLFCYSEFTLYQNRGRYTLNGAEIITSFWGITADIERYALACYFAEVTAVMCDTDELLPDVTRLMLYALRAIDSGKQNISIIKAAFEIRMMSESGFMPRLESCGACQKQNLTNIYFSTQEGMVICEDCANRIGSNFIQLGAGAYTAMCYCISSELPKLFMFNLGEQSLKQLSYVCENYLLYHTEKGFGTLDFYKKLFEMN